MEEKNQNTNEYTGEYGNSVEAGDDSQSSIYSYSYKDQPSEATQSGDYHADDNADANAASAVVEAEKQEEAVDSGQENQAGWQGQFASQPQDNWNNPYNSNYQSSQPQNETSQKVEKKEGLTLKKIGTCAALAGIFGVVAAVLFTAVILFSEKVLGVNYHAKNVEIAETTDNVTYETKENTEKQSVGTTDVSSIAGNTMPAIVAITSTQEGQKYYDFFGQEFQEEDIPSSGSGFIIGKNETELLIATNNHVIQGAKTISVQFIDEEVYEAKTKGTDSAADLAVIAVKLTDIKDTTLDSIKIATLGDSSEAKVGEMVVAIGNALGYGQSVTVGYISAKDREISASAEDGSSASTINVIQTDAAINPGNSGGALLNMRGEVIGINSAKIADSTVEGMGYAIPISEATPIINELKDKEVLTEDQKGYLGISGKTVTEEAKSFGMPEGVYVAEVAEGGAAQKAGIQEKDIIVAINDVKVTNIESLQEKANSYKKGTTVTITLKRNSNGNYVEKEVEVTLQGQSSLNSLQDGSQENSREEAPEEDSQGDDSQGDNSQEGNIPGEDNDSGNSEDYGFNDFFNEFFPFGW